MPTVQALATHHSLVRTQVIFDRRVNESPRLIPVQWDSFPPETICRTSVALLARLIELCLAQLAHAILFPQLDCEVGDSNLHIEDPQSFFARNNLLQHL